MGILGLCQEVCTEVFPEPALRSGVDQSLVLLVRPITVCILALGRTVQGQPNELDGQYITG